MAAMPRLAVLVAACALAGAVLACGGSTGGAPPEERATSLAQTAAALLTGTAAANATAEPATATLLPTTSPGPVEASPTATTAPTATAPAGSPTPSISPTPCENDSEFVADVNVPDGTHFAPGTAFVKTWRLRNSGQCTWTTAYQFRYISGIEMGEAAVNLAAEVPAGATVEISVAMTAPNSNGTHVSRYQLHSPDGTAFGTRPFVEIIVP